MNKARTLLTSLLCGMLIATLAGPAAARQHERKGVLLGLNLGGGNFVVVAEDDNKTTESDGESGGAAALRFGYGFNDQLVLGLESHSWGKEYSGGDVTASSVLLALTWYPKSSGFFVRGGVGAGQVDIEADLGAIRLGAKDEGAAVGLGLGYEWRLTRTFALGGALDFRYVDLDDIGDVDFGIRQTNYTVQLNWYL